MPNVVEDFVINALGIRFDGTTAVAGGISANALGVAGMGSNRCGMRVTNHGGSVILYKFDQTDTPPTISATSCDGAINGDHGFQDLFVDKGVRVYLLSSDATQPTWTAVEFK